MARRRQNPEPRKHLNKGSWEIYWYWKRKKYSIHPGLHEEDEAKATYLLHLTSAELLKDAPDFPKYIEDAPGVQKYLQDRYGATKPEELRGGWIQAYASTLSASVGSGWKKHSERYLNKLAAFSGDIEKVTSNQAQEFLNNIIKNGLSPATHNKALAACSKFFKWVVRTKRSKCNPFEGIKQLKEIVDHNIIYCTKKERDAVIALAKSSGWPDWISIPIAFYSGMRREEIARLQWADIRFDTGLIKVTKTKTGRSRETPLNATLEKMLLSIPEQRREGYVVIMEHRASEVEQSVQRADRMTSFIQHLRKTMKQKNPNFPIKNIGWNPFRHTFGSLLAQGGVSIDKISSWMGNTPEVCRRHYAQFIPRDRRDDEIDKL